MVESSAATDEDREQKETESAPTRRKQKVSIQTDLHVKTITYVFSFRIYCDTCDSCLVGEEDPIQIWV